MHLDHLKNGIIARLAIQVRQSSNARLINLIIYFRTQVAQYYRLSLEVIRNGNSSGALPAVS